MDTAENTVVNTNPRDDLASKQVIIKRHMGHARPRA